MSAYRLPSDVARRMLATEFIGTLINWCLQGVVLLATYSFFHNGRGDKAPLKALVAGLFVVSTLVSLLDSCKRVAARECFL
jgi:riboflavin transporter FmnP